MNQTSPNAQQIAVIGGGITGLAAAHRLCEIAPDVEVILFEADGRFGGILHTEHVDGYCIEHSADNFITNVPWGIDLCRRIGIEADLMETNASRRRALVVRDGRLHPIPEGFMLMAPARLWPLVTTPLLSPLAKLRLACEYFVPRRHGLDDESLASFATRRLGREAYERLVQPLVSGIYTADPEKLSVPAALPRFWEMEETHGSLIRGARAESANSNKNGAAESGARYSLFVAPKAGMGAIVDAIVERLAKVSLQLDSRVGALSRRGDHGWRISLEAGTDATTQERDVSGVILATAAHQTSRLLAGVDRPLADELGQIEHAGSVVAVVGYGRHQVADPLDGFGFVVPAVERRRILACSYTSQKFPLRAPDDHVLLRVFLGGAGREEVNQMTDEEILRVVAEELGDLLGVQGEPVLSRIVRWHRAMPQYHLGHVRRVERIEDRVAALPGLELAGNAYHGVGIPNCIRSGEQAAERIVRRFAERASGSSAPV